MKKFFSREKILFSNAIKIFCALIIFSCAVNLFTACNLTAEQSAGDDSSSASLNQEDLKYATVTGSIDYAGAFPKSFSKNASDSANGNSAKTAFPTNPEESDLVYTITATNGATTIGGTVTGYGTGDVTFAITLPYGNWTLNAEASSLSIGKKVLAVSKNFTIGSSNPIVSHNFVLNYIKDAATGTGDVSLTINLDSAIGATSLVVKRYSSAQTIASADEKVFDLSASPSSVTYEATGLAPDWYNLEISLYKDSLLLFRTNEIANVYSNMRTDSWISGGSASCISGGSFSISSTTVSKYAQSTFYISNTGNDSNNGTFFDPFRTIQKAVDVIVALGDTTNTYNIYLNGIITDNSTTAYPASNNYALVNIDPASKRKIKICNYDAAGGLKGSGASAFGRLFYIGANAEVDFQDVQLSDSTININGECGGGIYSEGDLTLTGETSITNCHATGNEACGGGICSFDGSFDLHHAKGIYNCSAAKVGGGIYSLNSLTLLGDSVSEDVYFRIKDCTAQYGSAIGVFDGTAANSITGFYFEGNSSTSAAKGGAVYAGSTGTGSKTEFEINDCVFVNNSAGAMGGAIDVEGGKVTLKNVKLKGNTVDTGIGNAVYVNGETILSGQVYTEGTNEFYLTSGNYITVDSTFQPPLVAGSQTHVNVYPSVSTTKTKIVTDNGTIAGGVTQTVCDYFTFSGTTLAEAILAPMNFAGEGKVYGVIKFGYDIYVSSTGSDTTGSGASSNPYATVTKGIRNATSSMKEKGITIHLLSDVELGSSDMTSGYLNISQFKSVNICGDTSVDDESSYVREIKVTASDSKKTYFQGNCPLTFDSIKFNDITGRTQSIFNVEELTFNNCTISNMTSRFVDSMNTVNLIDCTVSDCTVSDTKDGVIVFGTLNINGGNFTGLSATGENSSPLKPQYSSNGYVNITGTVNFEDCSGYYGGAIGASYVSSVNREQDTVFENATCTFKNCNAEMSGGAIFGSVEFKDSQVTFENCSARSGGAIYHEQNNYNSIPIASTGSTVVFKNCKATSSSGGGMYINGRTYDNINFSDDSNVIFDGCTAINSGGAIYLSSKNVKLGNVEFKDCKADYDSAGVSSGSGDGGGIYAYSLTSLTFGDVKESGCSVGEGDPAVEKDYGKFIFVHSVSASAKTNLTGNSDTEGDIYYASSAPQIYIDVDNFTVPSGKSVLLNPFTKTANTKIAYKYGTAALTQEVLNNLSLPEELNMYIKLSSGNGVLAAKPEVYVDAVSGLDTNTGSRTAPYKTFGTAVSNCPAGGTVHLMTDVNESIMNSVTKPKRISGYPAGTKVQLTLKDASTSDIVTFNSSGLEFDNVDLKIRNSFGFLRLQEGIKIYETSSLQADKISFEKDNCEFAVLPEPYTAGGAVCVIPSAIQTSSGNSVAGDVLFKYTGSTAPSSDDVKKISVLNYSNFNTSYSSTKVLCAEYDSLTGNVIVANNYDVYVDSSYAGVKTGSKASPFTTLSKVPGALKSTDPSGSFTVNLSDGYEYDGTGLTFDVDTVLKPVTEPPAVKPKLSNYFTISKNFTFQNLEFNYSQTSRNLFNISGTGAYQINISDCDIKTTGNLLTGSANRDIRIQNTLIEKTGDDRTLIIPCTVAGSGASLLLDNVTVKNFKKRSVPIIRIGDGAQLHLNDVTMDNSGELTDSSLFHIMAGSEALITGSLNFTSDTSFSHLTIERNTSDWGKLKIDTSITGIDETNPLKLELYESYPGYTFAAGDAIIYPVDGQTLTQELLDKIKIAAPQATWDIVLDSVNNCGVLAESSDPYAMFINKNTGKDDGSYNGSKAQPFKTLEHALDVLTERQGLGAIANPYGIYLMTDLAVSDSIIEPAQTGTLNIESSVSGTKRRITSSSGSGSEFRLNNVSMKDLSFEGQSSISTSGTIEMVSCTLKGFSNTAVLVDSSSNFRADDVTFDGNSTGEDGGALCVFSGDVILNNVRFTENTAGNRGGAIYITAGTITMTDTIIGRTGTVPVSSTNTNVNRAKLGGGIYIEGGTVTLEGTGNTISSNYASNSGGGVYLYDGTLKGTLKDMNANASENSGGAVFIASNTGKFPSLQLDGGTISYNKSKAGGAITSYSSGTAASYLENVTLSNNTASGGSGGAINIVSSNRLHLKDGVVITNNTATTYGGGVYCNGRLELSGEVNITGNKVGTDSSNVYLYQTPSKIYPDATFDTASRIGVSATGEQVITSGWNAAWPLSIFTMDTTLFHAVMSGTEVKLEAITAGGGIDPSLSENVIFTPRETTFTAGVIGTLLVEATVESTGAAALCTDWNFEVTSHGIPATGFSLTAPDGVNGGIVLMTDPAPGTYNLYIEAKYNGIKYSDNILFTVTE